MLMSGLACKKAYQMPTASPGEVTQGKMCTRVPPCVETAPVKSRALRYAQSVNDDLNSPACGVDTIPGVKKFHLKE